MYLLLLIGIASGLLVVLITLFFFQKRTKDEQKRRVGVVALRAQEGLPRRAQIARNQRNRLRQNAVALEQVNNPLADDDSEEEGTGPSTSQVLTDERIGTKKRAKLEAKEQKRIMREQELKMREEKKVKEAKMEEERKKLEEKEAEDERKKALSEKMAREEQERKELEEYLKLKEAFSIEEEGFEEADEDQRDNLLAEFIEYVKSNKVVVLEDLAVEFKLKTQQVIDRIKELQANETLSGVIDDRGKFIYISEEELISVAKFIKQRGRVSIAELAECSNNLINLTAVNSA